MWDVVTLSRLQFAATISFHYIYPPLSIGLGVVLVICESIWLATGKGLYHQLTRFWTRIFALTFAIGVATGIVMEFEFGTNWAAYSRFVGDVFGSALAAEGIFAFFLESGFLAVLLFGWDRVPRPVHFISTLCVCFGAHFSAVWIVVANSWQQTPAGFKLVGEGMAARAEITDFWAMVFNPSSVQRLSHVIFGAWSAGAFLVVSISAYYLLKRRHEAFARASMTIGLALACVSSVMQIVTGHLSVEVVAEHQPAKFAAFEGHYDSMGPASLYLFGWVDEPKERVIGLGIPGLSSWMLKGSFAAPVAGLNSLEKSERPPVQFVFQTYHAMVAIGMLLLVLSFGSAWLSYRGRLVQQRALLWILVLSVLGPQLANQLGWFTAEVGRQPWIVYGLLRTTDGISRNITADVVLTSLILFTIVYAMLFAVFVFLLNEKIKHGPDEEDLNPAGKHGLPSVIQEVL